MEQTYMKEQPVLKLMARMSLPMVISMLVNSLYNIVDSFFVAQISEEAMTALSLVFPVQNVVNAVTIGFGIGINAVIAFHLGAQDQKKADEAATLGTVLNLLHGVLLTVGCILIMPAFLRLFTADEAVASCLYTQIPESRINTELFNHHQKTEYPYNHTENAF